MKRTFYTHLQCHHCGKMHDKNITHTFCKDDHQPLEARYQLDNSFLKEKLKGRSTNMWRYREVLPIEKEENQISLGEGFTPLVELAKLANKYNQSKLLLKDESGNPTGSFKARGLSMAVSKAKELGIKAMCIPTAGNAGSALSAYCAKAGIEAHVFMPKATPKVFQLDCEVMGANVTKVDGNISDAAKMMQSQNDGSWFDVTTLKEPFRLEGKKTMGYEILEQLNWVCPDVIIYPTGTAGCDPVVYSFENKKDDVAKYENPAVTIANGLRVPKPFGDRMIMKTLYESQGTALAISEEEMKNGLSEFARTEGLFLSPEGAAVWEGYKKLKANQWIKEEETVVLLNTGSVYKYVENLY